MNMEMPVLNLYKHSARKNDSRADSSLSKMEPIVTANVDAFSQRSNQDLSGVIQSARGPTEFKTPAAAGQIDRSSSQCGGEDPRTLADKANLRFSNKSSVAGNLTVPVRQQRPNQRYSQKIGVTGRPSAGAILSARK